MAARQPHDLIRFDSLDPDRGARSFLFRDRVDEVVAWSRAEVLPALQRLQQAVDGGAFGAGFVAYEAAPALDAALVARAPVPGLPLLWFGIFRAPEEVAPLAGIEEIPAAYTIGHPTSSLDFEAYAEKLDEILELIAAGDTYQVNFTFRLRGTFSGSPLALYRDLARSQQSAFCAYLPMGRHSLVSASPELFFQLSGRSIELRPMKGTRPRGRWPAEDDALARDLAASKKDGAENLMIVDLLRNDVGRLAEFGSVAVPSLFEIERYPTVHQLTSTVTGRLKEAATAESLFRALFPSGSVTGAPKIRTTQIIADLEDSPRGPYTGAIGFFGPDRAVFSVAIRTVLLDEESGTYELGVGSGITADSDAVSEHAESLGKAAFLRARMPEFRLLESLRLEHPGGYTLLDRHIDRLLSSARYFGFRAERGVLIRALDRAARGLQGGVYKVRLLVDRSGEVEVVTEELLAEAEPIVLRLAPGLVDLRDPFLYHKTTHRAVHAGARGGVPVGGDALLVNPRGELTETTTSNLVLRIERRLVTPPVESGLLQGALRQELLERGELEVQVLTPADLERASDIYVINSVRGWRRAVMETGAPSASPGREC